MGNTGNPEKEQKMSEKAKTPQAQQSSPEEGKTVPVNEAEYQNLQRELSDCKDRYMRLFAEFENTRKRNERERAEFVKYANEGLIVQFLNILDDLERTVQVAGSKHQDYDAFLKGVEMVMAHIYELLKRHNVLPIEALGKKFDPHCHEVLMQVESKEHDDGAVVEEFQKGYTLGDKVVRTAKVKVAVHRQSEKATGSSFAEPTPEE